MNNIDSYLQELNEEVEQLRDGHTLPVMAFTQYITDSIAEMTNVDEHNAVHCLVTDSIGRIQGEIYGYGISANEEVLTLYYSIYDPTMKTPASLTGTEYNQALNRLQGFYNQSIRAGHLDMDEESPEYEVSKFIYDHLSGIMTVRLCLLSNYQIKDYTVKKLRIDGKIVNTDIWDINKICANLSAGNDHVAINIDFEGDDSYKMYQLPYIEMNSERCRYKCFSTMFPAKLLYKLYELHNTDLLMNNVRFFLGFKTGNKDTNNGMRKTLREENEMFLAYNNGITAVASGIEVASNNDATQLENEEGTGNDYISTGIIKKILDFQIVNGGQTTASIFTAKKKEPRDISLLGVYVMVKLIVISEDEKDKVSEISKFTNTQNKVKFADFSSNSKFNTEMERLSRKTIAPNPNNDPIYWFYERIRGQYKIELANINSKAMQESFKKMYPKDKRFDKEMLAKLWMSWGGEPQNAVKGASTTYGAFLKTIDDGKYAPDTSYFKQSVALLIIYQFLMSRKETKEYGNAKAPAVAYTMAYLNYITMGRIDLLKIWQNQDLSDESKTFLNKLCEQVKNELDKLAQAATTSVLSISKNGTIYPNLKNKDLGCDVNTIQSDMIP